MGLGWAAGGAWVRKQRESLCFTERRREAVNLKALGENKRQRRAKGRREGNGEKEE